MVVKRVAGALGAELQAVNLSDGIDAELAGTLRALLNEHEVLFLRDQVIEPAAQKALARKSRPVLFARRVQYSDREETAPRAH